MMNKENLLRSAAAEWKEASERYERAQAAWFNVQTLNAAGQAARRELDDAQKQYAEVTARVEQWFSV